MWIWYVLILVVLIVLFIILRKFKNPRIEVFNLRSGGNGTGKTSSFVCDLNKLLRRFYFLWRNRKIKNDYIILSNFPMGRLSKDGSYRYINIFGKHIKCYDLDLDILILKKRVPQNEVIIVIDEFSSIASQFDFNNPVVMNNMDEFFRMFRHYTEGKGYIFGMDQCTENIFLQLRRRACYCYNMMSCRKIPLLPIVIYEYRKILLSDEVKNVVELKNGVDENEIRKFIYFCNPFARTLKGEYKYYDSFCYSDRYKVVPVIEELKFNKINLKRNNLMKLTIKTPIYYNCLRFDGVDEEAYINSFKKKK